MMFFSVLQQVILLLLPKYIANIGFVDQFVVLILEPHLGAYTMLRIAQSHSYSNSHRWSYLGWSGLSVHSQVKSLLQSTEMRYLSFLAARLLHAALAFILSVLLWKPLNHLLERIQMNSLPAYFENVSLQTPHQLGC